MTTHSQHPYADREIEKRNRQDRFDEACKAAFELAEKLKAQRQAPSAQPHRRILVRA